MMLEMTNSTGQIKNSVQIHTNRIDPMEGRLSVFEDKVEGLKYSMKDNNKLKCVNGTHKVTRSLEHYTKIKSRDVGMEVLYEKGWNIFSV